MNNRHEREFDPAENLPDDFDPLAVKQRISERVGGSAPNRARARRRAVISGAGVLGVGVLTVGLAVGLSGGTVPDPAPIASDGVVRPSGGPSPTLAPSTDPQAEVVSANLMLTESLAALDADSEMITVLTDRSQTIVDGHTIADWAQRTVTTPDGTPHLITRLWDESVQTELSKKVYALGEPGYEDHMRELVAEYATSNLDDFQPDPDAWLAAFQLVQWDNGMWAITSVDNVLGIWARSVYDYDPNPTVAYGYADEDGNWVEEPARSPMTAKIEDFRVIATEILTGDDSTWTLVEGSTTTTTISGRAATCFAYEPSWVDDSPQREPILRVDTVSELCVDTDSKLPLRSAYRTIDRPYVGISPQLADIPGETVSETLFEWFPDTAENQSMFDLDPGQRTEVTVDDFSSQSSFFAVY